MSEREEEGFVATQTMWDFMHDPAFVRVLAGPVGCLAGETLVVTERGPQRIDALIEPTRVLSWDETQGRFRFVQASASFPKGKGALYRVLTPRGEWRGAEYHHVLCVDGKYRQVRELSPQDPSSALVCCAGLPPTPSVIFGRWWPAGVRRWMRIIASWMGRCGWLSHRCDRQPPQQEGRDLTLSPSQLDALTRASASFGDTHIHPDQSSSPHATPDSWHLVVTPGWGEADQGAETTLCGPVEAARREPLLSRWTSAIHRISWQLLGQTHSSKHSYSTAESPIVELTRELTQEVFWDLQVPGTNNYVTVDGAIHHNSGKSVCSCHELIRMALGQEPNAKGERKTRSLIVRNTADQLAKTARRSLFQWFPPGVWGTWKESEKTYYIKQPLSDGTVLDHEIWFMPLDTPQDVQRALSLEITFLWMNEGRELAPEVVDGLLARLKRYPSGPDGKPTRSCAILDSNMPDVDSWLHEQMENPPPNWSIYLQPPAILNKEEFIQEFGEDPDPDEAIKGYEDTEWWVNPNADNLDNLDPTYYSDICPGKGYDYINVYLRCRYGRSLSGLPVYDKTFSESFHIAETAPKPIRSSEYPVIIGLDFGRTPAAALGQRNVKGQLVLLDELTSENMGIETFLNTKLTPFLSQEKYLGCTFSVAPDPAGWFKQQIGEISPVDVVKRAGFSVVKPATNDPERRIMAVEALLTQQVDGEPALLISPTCRKLLQGFRYGYRYKLNRQGHQDNKPDKNEFSHCFVAGTPVLTPIGDVPIERLAVGDVVLTPFGPKAVAAVMSRSVDRTLAVSVGGRRLITTADHPFLTPSGVFLADALQYNSVLLAPGENIWAAQENTPSRSSTASDSIENPPGIIKPTIERTVVATCTAMCGSTITGAFQRATRFITKTTTKATTLWRIWSLYLEALIPATTRANALTTATLTPFAALKPLRKLLRSGTLQRRVESGTKSTGGAHGKVESPTPIHAPTVVLSSSGFGELTKKATAAQRASQQRVETAVLTTKLDNARYAATISQLIDTGKLKPVREIVGASKSAGPAVVYDITVEDAHCFFADGVLVGNCHDALQYLCLVASNNQLIGGELAYRRRRDIKAVSAAGWT